MDGLPFNPQAKTKKQSRKMTFRLLDDDLFFRHPLDMFFDEDDIWEPFSLMPEPNTRRRRRGPRYHQQKRIGAGPESTEKAGAVEGEQGQLLTTTGEPSTTLSTTSMHPGRLLTPIMNTDLVESEKDFYVHVDLPGVEPTDLDVSIADKFLVLKAERKQSHEEKTGRIHTMERSFGSVQRRIRLPNNADLDQAKSTFKNGVLSITFPKKADVAPEGRKLQINTA